MSESYVPKGRKCWARVEAFQAFRQAQGERNFPLTIRLYNIWALSLAKGLLARASISNGVGVAQ